MLNSLTIKNYVLIDALSIDFNAGFTSITGETGAGKSILIGALGLVLGDRADSKCLGNQDFKCVVESEFIITDYNLFFFFDKHNLDYYNHTVLRREINQNGRSRAFINDTPVNLPVLKELGFLLLDIHSQHQTLLINKQHYQHKIIDSFCEHADLLEDYNLEFKTFNSINKQLNNLKERELTLKKESDYKQFLFNEINELNLSPKTDSNIEDELHSFENFEEIKSTLLQAVGMCDVNEPSIVSLLSQLESLLLSVSAKEKNINAINERLNSVIIELKDCSYELNTILEKYEDGIDQNHFKSLKERAALINGLLFKHSLQTIEQLVDLKYELQTELGQIFEIDSDIERLEKKRLLSYEKANQIAEQLSANRLTQKKALEDKIVSLISDLGISNSNFIIEHKKNDQLTHFGLDEFQFKFTANKGVNPEDISKIASGGELSRLMLCFKFILAEKSNLSSILFDEIDTGVSGNIAHKMAEMMKKMSENIQVISITHLPQVAAKAQTQFLVSKKEHEHHTKTTISKLNNEDRINEIANMLSGQSITSSSIKNAADLLNAE